MGVKYLTEGQGASVAQSASETVHLYGGTGVAQRSSTLLATSFLSVSSNATVGSYLAAALTEIVNAIAGIGVIRTTA